MSNNNVDSSEIQKFDNLANVWWDLEGDMRMLHVINPHRLGFITKHVELANKKVLDIGCGGGILTEAMAKLGAEAKGIDMAEEPLNAGRKHAKENNISVDYECISTTKLAERETARYDVITCMEMLEHVPDPSIVINDCMKLLKPGGHLFFSTLNRNLKSFLFAIVGAEYVMRLLPIGTHEYKKLIRPAELEAWCSTGGFKLVQIASFMFNPLFKTFKTKYDKRDVNYITYFKKDPSQK